MALCKLDENNFCSRHNTHHHGHLAEYAKGDDAKSLAFQRRWDDLYGWTGTSEPEFDAVSVKKNSLDSARRRTQVMRRQQVEPRKCGRCGGKS
jgi:hypothetical protein